MTRALALLLALAVVPAARADDFFEAKIRPVLVQHCLPGQCGGPFCGCL